MPPKAQRTLSFAPPPPIAPATPSGTRDTPRRNTSTITNYAHPERIDEPFRNPDNPNKTPRASTRQTQDEDTEMGDRDEEDDMGEDKEEDEEVIIVPNPNTLSR
jgi:hypothetical protein